MELSKIKDKKIELFVENEVDIYKRNTDIDLSQMISIYLDSDGFIAFVDTKNNLTGYLEKSDSGILVELINDKSNLKKTIQVLLKENQLKLKNNFISYNESLIDVLKKLDNAAQIYFPVIKNNNLIGRISKAKLKERLDELY